MNSSCSVGPGEDLLGIVEDFVTKLRGGTITPMQAKRFLRKEDPFLVPMDPESQLKRWQELYWELFGIQLGLKSIKIPEQKPGFNRLILVPKGITMNQVVKICRTKFDMSLYDGNLDASVTHNDRVPIQDYAVWVQNNVEADPEFNDKSAIMLKKGHHQGITLLERLLYELAYFTETGKHLDVENATLCTGSRYSDGSVPSVYWGAGRREVCVHWYYPGYRRPDLRSRAAVVS